MINIFDISTLITDRTQADVQAWNDKGTYNPSDLNRVTHAMEHLVERIRSYGYTVKYEKVKVPHQTQRGKNRLPAGYTELEYIESTGTQYIDTCFKPNQDTRVVADIQMVGTPVNAFFFGGRTSTTSNIFCFLWLESNKVFRTDYNNKQKSVSGVYNDRVFVDFNKNIVEMNGTVIEHTYGTFQSTGNLFIFAASTSGTMSSPASARLYSFKMYDNGTLIRDFVPCTNTSGTVGLYDMVNGIFYGNAGTGVFTAGVEVESPPVEILDEYMWYHSDIPQERELAAYLQNVKWLREAMVLYPNTPEAPADMEGFTFAEANDIEQILVNIETIINLMLSSIIYSGEIFSGEVI